MLVEFPQSKLRQEIDDPRSLDRLADELAEIKQAMRVLRSRHRAVLNRYQAEVRRRLDLGLPLVLVIALSLTISSPGGACRKLAAYAPGSPGAVLCVSVAPMTARTMRR